MNACYARECWQEIRFADVAYSEDQAFGRAMLEAGWVKVFHPGAAVLHAHDYGPVEFARRYFDEYRGLREASGHVEPLAPRRALSDMRADARWTRERGLPAPRAAALDGALGGPPEQQARRLGARLAGAERLPGAVQRALSLERRGAAGEQAPAASPVPRGRSVGATPGPGPHEDVLRLSREGPAPLDEPVPGMAERPLHIAAVIPPFMRGSGGHNTLFTLLERLERLGHTCSIWLYDPHHRQYGGPATLRRRIVEEFVPLRAPAHRGFDDWAGADVALATGWDTAFATVLLPGCRARAYLIQDHEPEFFPSSAESLWAARTYELGLYGIAASRWLRDLLARRYGQHGTWFRLGVDHGTYRPRPVERRSDTVVYYAREYTPRRAVPLGALALEELHRRRPDTRFVLFGQAEELRLSFDYELLGVTGPETLAWRYSEGTVGLCLSLTNYSLIPQEMMACGLPCVDLAGGSTEAEIGRDGGVELARADPVALADALERLLDRRRAPAPARGGRAGLRRYGIVGRGGEAGGGGAAPGAQGAGDGSRGLASPGLGLAGLARRPRATALARHQLDPVVAAAADARQVAGRQALDRRRAAARGQDERADVAHPISVPGREAATRPVDRDPVPAGSQLDGAERDPARGPRQLVRDSRRPSARRPPPSPPGRRIRTARPRRSASRGTVRRLAIAPGPLVLTSDGIVGPDRPAGRQGRACRRERGAGGPGRHHELAVAVAAPRARRSTRGAVRFCGAARQVHVPAHPRAAALAPDLVVAAAPGAARSSAGGRGLAGSRRSTMRAEALDVRRLDVVQLGAEAEAQRAARRGAWA